MKYKLVCHSDTPTKNLLRSYLPEAIEDEDNYQYLFVIGGDGSFISQALLHWDKDIKIIHIKAGTNTFFGQNISKDLINDVCNKHQSFSNFPLLQVISDDGSIFHAINELYVQGSLSLNFNLSINNINFQTIRAHGLICTTQMGCTGINKSLGFPLFLNSLKAWLLGIIGPQNNVDCVQLNVPILLSEAEKVCLTFNNEKQSIYLDNKLNCYLNKSKNLRVSIVNSKAKVFKFGCTETYLENLNSHFIKNLK